MTQEGQRLAGQIRDAPLSTGRQLRPDTRTRPAGVQARRQACVAGWGATLPAPPCRRAALACPAGLEQVLAGGVDVMQQVGADSRVSPWVQRGVVAKDAKVRRFGRLEGRCGGRVALLRSAAADAPLNPVDLLACARGSRRQRLLRPGSADSWAAAAPGCRAYASQRLLGQRPPCMHATRCDSTAARTHVENKLPEGQVVVVGEFDVHLRQHSISRERV